MYAVLPPFPIYADLDGSPLDNGSIYFGVANQNPETNPIAIYWDAAGTQPAAQPVKTLDGFIVRNGTPAAVFVSVTDYSTTIRDRKSALIYSALNINLGSGGIAAAVDALRNDLANKVLSSKGAGLIGFSQSVSYLAGTVGASLRSLAVNVKDDPFLATGNGVADDTAALIAAAATGRPILLPYGDYVISEPVTISGGLIGQGADDGQTTITLVGNGQLIVGDWHATWDGFFIRSAVNNKKFIRAPGMSYFSCTNFRAEKIGAATGQVAIEFDTTTASVYFSNIDNFKIKVDYPFNIVGNNTQVFNANKLGTVATAYYQNFQSAIAIDGVLACDANQFAGYFEVGINAINHVVGAMRQNRFHLVLDAVTRAYNGGVAVSDPNIWEILDGGFTSAGSYPQNQIFIGPASTKIRATDTSSTPAIPNATAVTMTFDGEVFDTLSEFTPGTGIFQPKNAGYYQVDAQAITQAYTWPSGTRFEVQIYKNGALYASGMYNASETGSAVSIQRSGSVTSIVYMNGTTDTLTIKLLHNRGANTSLDTSPTYNFVNIARME